MARKKYSLIPGTAATKVIDLSPRPVKTEQKRKKTDEPVVVEEPVAIEVPTPVEESAPAEDAAPAEEPADTVEA